jgi:xanthine dehydrogenase iron-sulfur cluster and FAD-binding subunit A
VIDLDKNNEIVSGIEIALEPGMCHFEKTSKRVTLDISSVNSAMFLRVDEHGKVLKCRLVYGGVAKTPILAKASVDFLLGKKITSKIVDEVAKLVASEFQPISDIRGSAEYRKILIGNHILKHLNAMKLL